MNYEKISKEARNKVLELIFKAQTSHIGSNFSCIDILTVLFEKIDLDKDKFILSAGWKAASLYYFLWRKGRITEEELNSYCQEGSKFIGLSEPIHPDIPFAGGSMGMGLPAGIGFALAKKLKGEDGNIYVLMSDGEMQCGTTWESIMIAKHHKLDNLVVLVDANDFQAMGKVDKILPIPTDNLELWRVLHADGHNFEDIERCLGESKWKDTPELIWCKTIKGKGVSFMENNNDWHYRNIDKESYELAKQELR